MARDSDWPAAVFVAVVFAAIIFCVGALIGSVTERSDADREHCQQLGVLLHRETQYRGGECQLRVGEGWVWLSEMLEGDSGGGR